MAQRWYMDPTNPDAAAYRAKNGIKLPGEKTPVVPQPSGPAPQPQLDPKQMVTNAGNLAGGYVQRGDKIAQGAQNYTQNNPFTKSAAEYQQQILNGDISNNPFMQGLQSDLNGVNMDESFNYLRDFLGPVGGGSGSGSGGLGRSQYYTGDGVHGASGSIAQSQSGGSGNVPDTVGNSNSFFAQHIKDLFDPSRLDPKNDPTMQPYLDMITRQANEALMGQLQDVSARAEGSGMYGSGLYQAMDRQARGTSQQGLSDAITKALMGARSEALQNQMGGLGLTNARDIAAMNDATQRYGIDSSASSAGAGAAAAAADAAQGRKLQAIQMMMQGGQFGLGLKNDLASTLQGGQSAAMNAGIGYGNLGLGGYNTALNAGQLGLQGLGLQGQLGLGQQGVDLQGRQLNAQNSANRFSQQMQLQNAQQDSLNDYLNIILGIGGAGGTQNSVTTSPGTPTSGGIDPWMAALLGGMGGYNSGGQ